MAKHGLCILPRCTERIVTERQTAKGGVLFYVVVRCEFDFIAASDGSRHVVVTYGEAMDSGDKATNKAMSAAYKYAAFQAFAIPTEGDNDADATTHEVAARKDTDAASVRDYLDAIALADGVTLEKLGSEIAASHVSVGGKKTLRAAFGARMHALKDAA